MQELQSIPLSQPAALAQRRVGVGSPPHRFQRGVSRVQRLDRVAGESTVGYIVSAGNLNALASGLAGGVCVLTFAQRRRRLLRARTVMCAEDEEDDIPSAPRASAFIPPIGPFCPFQSEFSRGKGMNEQLERLTDLSTNITKQFAPIMLNAQMGKLPDPEVVKPLAADLREAQDLYTANLARSRLSEDFQGREFYNMTEAIVNRAGLTLDNMKDIVEWQMGGMLAYAEGRLPPPPPPGITEEVLAKRPDISNAVGLGSASITVGPFDPNSATMRSEVVQAEFRKLLQDHEGLIKLGEQFGSFDPAGKLLYLDQIDDVEQRWDILFTRLQLTGDLNPEYTVQVEEYLKRVSLTPVQFREVLKAAHNIMRKDAEAAALL
mmetsp:Transcript_10555/g.24015  ORF Transcript_10555/g.24015 Transcript_10555/m.24015 type:complete len:377 (+) Transcript_10555:100-1230(+)